MREKIALKTFTLPAAAVALFAFSGSASAQSCDRACLLQQAKRFNENMLAHTVERIPLGPSAQVRENTRTIALVDSKWIITSYFQGLTDHQPIEADFDVRCDRYHSGNQVTHNERNGVEGSGNVGCYESNLGPKPWGPATEARIALVDLERGIVIDYSILRYGDSGRAMQINEIFEILNGRIRMVDNIGLMNPGIKTSGFTK